VARQRGISCTVELLGTFAGLTFNEQKRTYISPTYYCSVFVRRSATGELRIFFSGDSI